MPVSPKIIRRRIRSVANTRKITKAMELVAGAKMRKTVTLSLMSREYARSLQNLVAYILPLIDPQLHVLLKGKKVSAVSLVVVAASDRGLCGPYNSQLIKKTLGYLHNRHEQLHVVTVGRRAEQAIKRAGYNLRASFAAISNAPSFERTRPIGTLILNEFLQGGVDRVFLISMDFTSAIAQTPVVQQLLPIIPEAELVDISGVSSLREGEDDARILFEPSSSVILNSVLPRLLETQVYQALLESSAAEHSARRLAMQSATENATDMLEDLSFTFNQARQAVITREISEISAGKAAIE